MTGPGQTLTDLLNAGAEVTALDDADLFHTENSGATNVIKWSNVVDALRARDVTWTGEQTFGTTYRTTDKAYHHQEVGNQAFINDIWDGADTPSSIITNSTSGIQDNNPDFVADPFAIRVNGKVYLFFENMGVNKEIWVGESTDGVSFSNFQQAIPNGLDIDYSFPFVFRYDDRWYMAQPEYNTGGAKLLTTTDADFPAGWGIHTTLFDGNREYNSDKIKDPLPFRWNGWWVCPYTGSDGGGTNKLCFAFSRSLTEGWFQAPYNPIYMSDDTNWNSGTAAFAFVIGRNLYLLRASNNETFITHLDELAPYNISITDSGKRLASTTKTEAYFDLTTKAYHHHAWPIYHAGKWHLYLDVAPDGGSPLDYEIWHTSAEVS